MSSKILNKLVLKRQKLKNRYLRLMERAYNLRQTDHALSDISEYEAKKVLNELNKLSFIVEEDVSPSVLV
ncbi:Lacal_2735 family protein [Winogradskyella ursingii]|uniref:Lacal_2735 family protein n=1 Tax=Winogradskyella ursingii TaxID=2686079 RepID=UPI0015C7074E|nr:Lacal_2735 family protein [Winogradskyella ursingii]